MTADVMDLFPTAEEGDTILLERRRCYTSGRVEWVECEATVTNVRSDGIRVEYTEPNEGNAELQLLFDYGSARLAERTQRSLGQFVADSRTGASPASDTEPNGGGR